MSAARRDWMSVSRRTQPPSVAGHDAPLIGERAETRGRSATKVAMSAPAANDHDQGRARSSMTSRPMSIAPAHTAAPVTVNDAPLIGERAATRGRITTKGGDVHIGVELPLGEPDRAGISTRLAGAGPKEQCTPKPSHRTKKPPSNARVSCQQVFVNRVGQQEQSNTGDDHCSQLNRITNHGRSSEFRIPARGRPPAALSVILHGGAMRGDGSSICRLNRYGPPSRIRPFELATTITREVKPHDSKSRRVCP
jgi:hypothetical protein